MGRMLIDDEDRWEYGNPPSIVMWAESHVLLAVAGAALAWFAAVYVLALVVDAFVAH